MKAVIVKEYGDINVLQNTSIDIPAITNPDEVLVRVKSFGISPFDLHVREGWYKDSGNYQIPIILGWEIAGDIVEKGNDVSDFQVGDAIFGHPSVYHNAGGYAEYVVLNVKDIAKKPKNISYATAAAASMNALTAWQALFDTANLSSGQTVLIHAGAGGVGHIAIQLAKWVGAKVIATGSETNKAYLKEIGVDQFIDYQKQNITDVVLDKVDVVLDTIGNSTLLDSFHLLCPGGIAVSIVDFDNIEKAKDFGVRGQAMVVEPNQKQLEQFADLLEKKIVTPTVHDNYTLDTVKEAHQLLAMKHVRGKLVANIT